MKANHELTRRDYERLERWRFECLLQPTSSIEKPNALHLFESLSAVHVHDIDCSPQSFYLAGQVPQGHVPGFCYLCHSKSDVLVPYCSNCKRLLYSSCWPSSSYWWRYQCALKLYLMNLTPASVLSDGLGDFLFQDFQLRISDPSGYREILLQRLQERQRIKNTGSSNVTGT